jgi:hypothetical protein
MSYIGNQPVLNTSEFREEFAVTSTQTVFNTGGFTASSDSATLEVLRNGVLLGTADYTLGSDASTVTLANAAVNGDIIVIKGRRELTNGVQVTEFRYEETIANNATTVTPNYTMVPAYTDVFLNGVRLAKGNNGVTADYSISSNTVSFTTNPVNGDLVQIISREAATSIYGDSFASTSEVQGVYTTATTAKATNANQLTSVTAVSGYSLADISVGDYVTGEGIRVGTTVSAISGTTITLYHPDGDALSSSMTDLSGDPVSFYNSTKALSAGTVAGGLCRAWVNYNTSTNSINASFNVSSVTDAAGNLVVNFTTAMQDANYSVQVTAGAGSGLFHERVDNLATGSFRIYTYRDSGVLTDYNPTCAAVFR